MSFAFVALIGLFGGFLAGLLGVGGGILFVPALTLVLGLTQLHAEASSLLAILPAAFVGTWRLQRRGQVDLRVAGVVGAASVAGVQVGVLVAEALPGKVLTRLFGGLLIIVALRQLAHLTSGRIDETPVDENV